MKIGILGAGSWGTTVAHLLARKYDVTLWARDQSIAHEINQHHLNTKYLGQSELSPRLQATSDLEIAVIGKALIIVAIPAQNFRDVLTQAVGFFNSDAAIISLSKEANLAARVVLPQPLSPTIPRDLPLPISKLIPSTALTVPCGT